MLSFTSLALAASPPTVTVEWRKDRATVLVEAAEGEKIAPDAPARVVLDWGAASIDLAAPGAVLHEPVSVAELRGATLEGRLEVGLCALDGDLCTPTTWALAGEVPAATRGAVTLRVTPPAADEGPTFGPGASADVAAAAFERAKRSGRPVLLDFSAVWCPPCNLLAAEVLHADPLPVELEAYEVAVLDADARASFELKDRYDVGGYPTVLVVDPDGNEKTRVVGYPGKEAMLAWLAGAAGSSDAVDLAAGPGAATPERAAALAWQLLSSGEEEAAPPWLERARAGGADTAELRLASLAVGGTGDDARWIVARAPDRAVTAAVVSRGTLPESDPAAFRELLEAAGRHARGTEHADLLELRADLLPEGPEKRALYAGAAAAVAATLTGDPAKDKGLQTWLAALHESAGATDRAIGVLEAASLTWPGEPTWDLALSPLLLRAGRAEDALAAARRAIDASWDDNRLRAVAAEAKALHALGRVDEARAAAAAELEAQPAPPPGTNPRTERYRERLRELADGASPAGG